MPEIFSTRLRKAFFLLGTIGLIAVVLAVGYVFTAKHPNVTAIFNVSSRGNTRIAYPSSTNICTNGCKAHQNWVEFYLPSDGFSTNSLRLRTRLFLAQVLTVGISGSECAHQDKAGFTCVDMEISHTLLSALTASDLTPLGQLQDTRNWWLEYAPEQ